MSHLYRVGGTNTYLEWWQPIPCQRLERMSDRQVQHHLNQLDWRIARLRLLNNNCRRRFDFGQDNSAVRTPQQARSPRQAGSPSAAISDSAPLGGDGKKPLHFYSATLATCRTSWTKGPTATPGPVRGLHHRCAGISMLPSDWLEQTDAIGDSSAGASVNPGRQSGRRTF